VWKYGGGGMKSWMDGWIGRRTVDEKRCTERGCGLRAGNKKKEEKREGEIGLVHTWYLLLVAFSFMCVDEWMD